MFDFKALCVHYFKCTGFGLLKLNENNFKSGRHVRRLYPQSQWNDSWLRHLGLVCFATRLCVIVLSTCVVINKNKPRPRFDWHLSEASVVGRPLSAGLQRSSVERRVDALTSGTGRTLWDLPQHNTHTDTHRHRTMDGTDKRQSFNRFVLFCYTVVCSVPFNVGS